ncbi:MAG TPA: hypothetical protein VFF81_11560 [Noviherbaspirillum sp.]|nr:hypothetical protein [Noviherbaspirillum sp.]
MLSDIATNRKTTPPRVFPFVAGTNFKPSDYRHAETALRIFGVLWSAVKAGELSGNDIQKVFFDSISDPITYRESWKCGKFWSVAAWEKACADGITNKNGLISEHVLPRRVALEHALALPTVEEAKQFIWNASFECVITEKENAVLNQNGLQSKGFPTDPWERYRRAGIRVLDVQHPVGTHFLSDADRSAIGDEILVAHHPSICSCKHCQ